MVYLQIAFKLLAGAFGVFMVLRIMGKKAISDLTPFDLVYTLVLSGTLEESIYDQQVTIFQLIFTMILWALVVYGIELILEKTEKISKWVEGEPSVLIDKGRINKEQLQKNHMKMEQLRKLLRKNGCHNIKDIDYAILEVDGDMSVIRKSDDKVLSVLLIDDGVIDYDTLEKTVGKDDTWLRNRLDKEGFPNLNEIFYCERLPDDSLYIISQAETITGNKALDE